MVAVERAASSSRLYGDAARVHRVSCLPTLIGPPTLEVRCVHSLTVLQRPHSECYHCPTRSDNRRHRNEIFS